MYIDFKESFNKLELSGDTFKIIDEFGIKLKDIAIGEFSGKDSAAAIIEAFREFDVILPVVAFTGTDYGDKKIFYKNWELLNDRVKNLYNDKVLLPLHFMFEPKLWNALNGRFVSLIIKKFGFYTPCIGCHAYLRILRIPLSKHLGSVIIGGERIHHNGDFKIDQVEMVLEIYERICNELGVKLKLPIKYVKENSKIKDIIGVDWKQGKRQFSCVFSGNYRDKDGKVIFEEEKVRKFLNEFIYPVSVEIVKRGYVEDFKYIEIVKEFI
ncbi:hypothetical protein [Methanotorris formicicus]|uniref:Uncharacterized protein n=1 Tax=Methanotorris formicicus Mc-S-70 TaxID=647171 RepID=H1KW74_9EURY|nr:hypothetical protein [Methanotorris formicicus]EHP89657.1 hypothetical protein MetfoDRAFT_0047 [Methanotorris formicicus Mc-S-70]